MPPEDEGAFSYLYPFTKAELRSRIEGLEFHVLAKLLRTQRKPQDWRSPLVVGIHRGIFGKYFPKEAGYVRKRELQYGPREGLLPTQIDPALHDVIGAMRMDLSRIVKIENEEERTEATFLTAATHHAEMIRIHPFIDGNGRWARAVTSAYICDAGFESGTLVQSGQKKIYIAALDRAIDERECGDLANILLEGYLEQSQRREHGLRPMSNRSRG
jgi:fido (protein-threonine AMPylation protein)